MGFVKLSFFLIICHYKINSSDFNWCSLNKNTNLEADFILNLQMSSKFWGVSSKKLKGHNAMHVFSQIWHPSLGKRAWDKYLLSKWTKENIERWWSVKTSISSIALTYVHMSYSHLILNYTVSLCYLFLGKSFNLTVLRPWALDRYESDFWFLASLCILG